MRLVTWVSLVVSLGACTEPDLDVRHASINWMEWPAEVSAGTPFPVRLVGWGTSCVEVVRFVTAPAIDGSAVTFEPYFLTRGEPQLCRELVLLDLLATVYDTLTPVRGLAAPVPRSYAIRGASDAPLDELSSALPIRAFGDVRVGFDSTGRLNVAGLAGVSRDQAGCLRLAPYGLHPGYVVENLPPDEPGWSGFARGYVYDAAAAVCGETRVFHLVSRN